MGYNNNNIASRIRQNYKEDCEALVNKQINMELYASYVYMSLAYYFDRDDVAYSGFHSFFKKNSDEERDHAEKFIKYQNRRKSCLPGHRQAHHHGVGDSPGGHGGCPGAGENRQPKSPGHAQGCRRRRASLRFP